MNSFDNISNFDKESSYKKNSFGFFFYSLIKTHKPKSCIELGVLNCYSTVSIACGLRDNKSGTLKAVDLFEDYEHKSNQLELATETINKHKLEKYVSLIKDDVFCFSKKLKTSSIDFIHLDISNDADKLVNFLDHYYDKIKRGGLLVIEGGSEERDECGWMKKFNKPPIRNVLEDDVFKNKFDFFIVKPYPSVIIAYKK